MIRQTLVPRPHAAAQLNELGLVYHADYWDESVCYRFNAAQIDALDDAATLLHDLCLQAVARVIAEHRWADLAIPTAWHQAIRQSWEQHEGALFGRFDLMYDGQSPPKLLEYNADTPTALMEASVAQWHWLNDVYPHADQFNGLHEALIDRWRTLRPQWRLPAEAPLHFTTALDATEDHHTLLYLAETAQLAGYSAQVVDIQQLGWTETGFVDADNQPIYGLCKLYPWEWLVREPFGELLADQLVRGSLRVGEPPWKMILSNKALLALLWEWFPDHPHLLPAVFTPDPRIHRGKPLIQKSFFSREGAGLAAWPQGWQPDLAPAMVTPCDEDGGGRIYQQWQPLPNFDGHFPVCGVWMVGGKAVGLGLREDRQLITRNTSRFVPHYFE